MSNQINSTNSSKLHPMERMTAAAREYMAALEEHVSAKGLKPVWYSLSDDADFNFGFVCRLEPA
ncbi:MAG: hypothetical protein E5X80_04985 [Mesorhizobium sp.]|uniref:hypothetical protein n=1 Tax=Mesorhizobium sp. TaxID=1871066 RepID=UPI0012181106|nr:hypothetical protein [Mesorhizobium sp.]TIO52979.1 MAG: hypothetical protein E5X78_10060 [Mesorhizobium sp.]TIO61812.1 MAG: hypothetical protein E5X79_05440 [Mesorhizobium sp.]TJV66733.1 MAG: hypothetical protein E5X80_04985 [Mesorhizobium sp.]